MSRGPRHTFECRPYCFYDSGSFVRRRGITCAQRSRLLRGSRSARGPRACAKTCLGDVAMVKKWQYTRWDAFTARKNKINLVRCLTNRAAQICSPQRLDEELDCIRKIFANKGYPPHVVNLTIRTALNRRPRTTDSDSDVHFIYMKLPWIGDNRSEAFEKLII